MKYSVAVKVMSSKEKLPFSFFRFSGITEDDIKNEKTSLIDVQAVLLCLFNDKTILIGHSLESDFKALKVSRLILEYFCVSTY